MIQARLARETLTPEEFAGRARNVRLLALDVDGILTDGRLIMDHQGHESKAFHTRDGQGLKLLRQEGITLALITGRRSPVVELRAAELGIQHLAQGVDDKLAAWTELLASLGLTPGESAYMGDDVVDLPILRRCALAATVPEAPALVRQHVHRVTVCSGGQGAVREFCEMLLAGRGSLDAAMAPWLL